MFIRNFRYASVLPAVEPTVAEAVRRGSEQILHADAARKTTSRRMPAVVTLGNNGTVGWDGVETSRTAKNWLGTVEAGQTHRFAVPLHIFLSPENFTTVGALEMMQMPRPSFRFCALFAENQLITSGTTGLDLLGMVATTVDISFVGKIDQINEQSSTVEAMETGRMEGRLGPCRMNRHLALFQRMRTSFATSLSSIIGNSLNKSDSYAFGLSCSVKHPEIIRFVTDEFGAIASI